MKDNYYKFEMKRQIICKLKRFMPVEKFAGMRYAGGRLHSAEQGNQRIKEHILLGEPFMVGRLGQTEMSSVIARETGGSSMEERLNADKYLSINAGFFPCDSKAIDHYTEIFLEAISSMDLMGIYFFINNEEYMIQKYMDAPYCALPRCLEPFYYADPWSGALVGKRVLVIHPFAETIRRQYEKRAKLFHNPNILPEFDLQTIRAVQTSGGHRDDRFTNWFEALEWMKGQIDQVNFDIALLGCGAYGIPLQAYIKRKGKQSVYVGGGLQILFGIKGQRWDEHPFISKLYNEYWVRPSEIEKFDGCQSVEGVGPYW